MFLLLVSPTHWMVSSPPMPSHRAKLSTTEATAGSTTSTSTKRVGTATISVTTTRSVDDIRRKRRRGASGVPSAVRLTRAAGFGPGRVMTSSLVRARLDEDRLLLLLHALEDAVDVVRVLDEALERRDDDGRGEV